MIARPFHDATIIAAWLFCSTLTGMTAFAAGLPEEPATVVATTSWTAAFAQAAGVQRIHVLAPAQLRHPAEYELKPSDIEAVTQADLVIYAGYEIMIRRIQDAIGGEKPDLLQITTDYRMDTIRRWVLAIADATGERTAAKRSIQELEAFYSVWRQRLPHKLKEAPVLVHFFQRSLAEELGLNVAGVFGPGPLEARQIVDLSAKNAILIIDNWHNQVGSPLKEAMPGIAYAALINFPGEGGTESLIDVLGYNRRTLEQTDL